jgi:hypothetical protein
MRDVSYSWQSWSGLLVSFLTHPSSKDDEQTDVISSADRSSSSSSLSRSSSLTTQHLHRQQSHVLLPAHYLFLANGNHVDTEDEQHQLLLPPTSGGNIWTTAGTVCPGLNDEAMIRLIPRLVSYP